MAQVLEFTAVPPEEGLGEVAALFGDAHPGTATLSGPDGTTYVLPDELYEVLRTAALSLSRGYAVTIASVAQRLTTQQAADMLGVSRPTFVKLLENGDIPYERPGRHRRVLLEDVLAYQATMRAERRDALDNLVEISDQAGLYDSTAEPIRTR